MIVTMGSGGDVPSGRDPRVGGTWGPLMEKFTKHSGAACPAAGEQGGLQREGRAACMKAAPKSSARGIKGGDGAVSGGVVRRVGAVPRRVGVGTARLAVSNGLRSIIAWCWVLVSIGVLRH